MTSQNLSELAVDNVDFNNDRNHLPPNGKIKQLALISGWDDWQNCTNHGLRALGVTTTVCCKDNNLPNKAVPSHTRHANEKS